MLLPAPCWSPSTPEDYFRFGLFRFRSPLLTESISLSFPPLTEMFHFSGSRVHNPMDSGYVNRALPLLGYPIRIPPGLRSLAALRGFSQLAASFFACWHQGIHHKPLGSSFESPPVTHLNLSFKCFLLVCLILVSLFLEIVFPTKLLEYRLSPVFFFFATRMSICSLRAAFSFASFPSRLLYERGYG